VLLVGGKHTAHVDEEDHSNGRHSRRTGLRHSTIFSPILILLVVAVFSDAHSLRCALHSHTYRSRDQSTHAHTEVSSGVVVNSQFSF
jgi:hypothetical protein